MLSEEILRLKQAINSVGASCPLDEVKLDFVDKLEFESNNNPHFKESLNKMLKLVNKCNQCIEDYEALSEFWSLD